MMIKLLNDLEVENETLKEENSFLNETIMMKDSQLEDLKRKMDELEQSLSQAESLLADERAEKQQDAATFKKIIESLTPSSHHLVQQHPGSQLKPIVFQQQRKLSQPHDNRQTTSNSYYIHTTPYLVKPLFCNLTNGELVMHPGIANSLYGGTGAAAGLSRTIDNHISHEQQQESIH